MNVLRWTRCHTGGVVKDIVVARVVPQTVVVVRRPTVVVVRIAPRDDSVLLLLQHPFLGR